MKKDVITLEKITYKNYVKVLFGLNVNRKQKEFVASNMCSCKFRREKAACTDFSGHRLGEIRPPSRGRRPLD